MNSTTLISDKILHFIINKISCDVKGDIVIVLDNNISAQILYEDLKFTSQDKIFLFPEWDISLYDNISPSQQILTQRISTLFDITQTPQRTILLTTVTALLQKTPSLNEIQNFAIKIEKGTRLKREQLIQMLITIGYTRESITSSPLHFSVRGEVLDIQTTKTIGIRLTFFSSEIESIKIFDPITQLSKETIDSINIYPSSEVIMSSKNIELFKQFLSSNLGSKTIESEMLSNIAQGIKPNGIEHYLSKFYTELVSIADYLDAPTIISTLPLKNQITNQISKIQMFFKLKKNELENINKEKLKILLTPEQILIDPQSFQKYKNIDLISYKDNIYVEEIPSLRINATLDKKNIINYIINLFNDNKGSKKNFIISCQSEGSRTRLYKIFQDDNIPVIRIDSWPIPSFYSQICLIISPIRHSFKCASYCFITEQDIFGQEIKKIKKTDSTKTFRNRHTFFLNSFVVHKEHGIGQFKGLETIRLSDSKHDCLQILYKDNDKLFVPVENIDLLTKYSDEAQEAILDKLGAHNWKTRQGRVKKKIQQIANHLLQTAAKRLVHKSEIIELNQELYDKFCKTFPYIETEDQERSIQEVLNDLKTDLPMDRLICGDAGVGKTEIALRAAFATITSEKQYKKKQVALISPTTLLCKQHFNSAYTRLKNFDINIAQLSRFTPKKDIKNILQDLENGSIDIIIGTHSLLSKRVKFNNLSLVIIDEEQHFGVSQKEHLKTTKENVNILTLSATPIPRTLQMSLAGIKELSLIRTPPLNRHKTKVLIEKFSIAKAAEVILREFHRNGQSFFVCPRIKDLEDIEPTLRELLPNIKIISAHGGMTNTELENKIMDFYEGKADLLLSTSIIESGLDIPRANTIIIYKSELFGLGQLYQLKGRVGRSNIESSAYFMVSSNSFNETTLKRLSILENAGEAGAGFMISSHDMDIRGFGNLLGDEQSGNIKEIGIELYQKMLEDTMNSIKYNISEEDLEKREKAKEVQINLGIPVLIPEEYIPDFDLRMSLYQKLSSLETDDQIELFAAEMIDRFGTIPESFENLISIIKLKNLCKHYHIKKIDAGPKAIMIQLRDSSSISPEDLLSFIKNSSLTIKLKPDNKLLILSTLYNPRSIFLLLNTVITSLKL